MLRILTALVALIVVLGMSEAEAYQNEPATKPKRMEWLGLLRTGVVAIGGETTGVVLQRNKETFELDFGKQKELRAKAEKLSGKDVLVSGTLEIRKGVEVKERKIITVITIEEAKLPPKK